MKKSVIRKGAVFAGALLSLALGACGAQTPESVLAQMEKEEPFYAALRTEDPATYAKIRQTLDEAISRGDQAGVRPKLRAIVLPAILARVPTTSAKNLDAFAGLARDQGHFIASKHPSLCNEFLRGEDIGADKIVPADLKQRELKIYEDLIRTPAVTDTPRMSPAEMDRVFTPIILSMAQQLGLSQQEAGAALSQQGPEAMQCKAAATLFDGILKRPAAEREKLLRTLLSEA